MKREFSFYSFVKVRIIKEGKNMEAKNITRDLLQEWPKLKPYIQNFLDDPLSWVAKELDELHKAVENTTSLANPNLETRLKSLVDMLRFIDANRNLLMPKEYTESSKSK